MPATTVRARVFSDSHSAESACVSARVTIRSVPETGSVTPNAATAPLIKPRNVSEGLFQLLGINMLASANDDVFDAAGDEDIAVGHVRPIAAVEPAVAEQFSCLGLIVEIARGRGWTAKLEPALSPLLNFPAGIVDNTNFMARQRAPASDNFNGVGIVDACGFGNSAAAQRLALDAIDERFAARWRQRQRDGTLGKTIDRGHGLRWKSVPAESLDESTKGVNTYWLRTVRYEAKRAQVETR